MFQKILVPVDLTDQNAGTVEVAGDLAVRFGGSVSLLHVIETLDAPMEELRDFYQDLEQRALDKLQLLAKDVEASSVTVDRHLRYGKRAAEIVSFAEDQQHDLIVMRSHRLNRDNPAQGFLTISHQVAIAANTPVLIIK